MNKETADQQQAVEKVESQNKAYTRPELKKHGKLKSNASQYVTNVYTYTYTYIT